MIKVTPLLLLVLILTACDHTHVAYLDAAPALSDGVTHVHVAPPWAPPVARADGGTAGGDGGTVSPPPGPARWTLTGDVAQITPCAGGGSASQVHVALSTGCGDWSTLLQQQKVSLAAAKPRYVFQVPDGSHHMIAFADCNGDGVEGPGDVRYVTQSPGQPQKPCRSYKLAGQGLLDLPLKLDTLVK